MARIRTLKPDFWSDSKMVKLSPFARLFYLGMWNFALCERGHLQDDADDLKLKILPGDAVNPAELLGELLALGRVQRRRMVDGRTFLLVPKLPDHQKVDPRWKPRCPYCCLDGSDVLVQPDEPTGQPDEPIAVPERTDSPARDLRVTSDESGTPIGPVGHAASGYPRDQPEQTSSPKLSDTPPNSPELALVREGKGREGKGIPPSAGAVAPRAADSAQTLVGEWLDHVPKRPPGSVIARVGKQLRAMLDEGIAIHDLRRGLAEWATKGLDPSVLPSVVNAAMNGGGPARASPRRSTTDDRVAQALTLADELELLEPG